MPLFYLCFRAFDVIIEQHTTLQMKFLHEFSKWALDFLHHTQRTFGATATVASVLSKATKWFPTYKSKAKELKKMNKEFTVHKEHCHQVFLKTQADINAQEESLMNQLKTLQAVQSNNNNPTPSSSSASTSTATPTPTQTKLS